MMNPPEPVVPDPDPPIESPSNPVEEPPSVDDIERYEAGHTDARLDAAGTLVGGAIPTMDLQRAHRDERSAARVLRPTPQPAA